MASTQFDVAGNSNPVRKVRVVAKIRGFSGPETNSGTSRTVEWVSVNRENPEDVTISFKEQSSSRYLVDYCYNEHEENEIIYSREVKPLVSAVFEGHNSTVIAHGARGSGKTHVIQGSFERPGLAVLATSEFLSMAEKNGKSIAVSFYEVDHQDRAVDLLNPEQPQILVLEDRGKIQFKGLTQVPVKSIAQFQNLYSTACSAQNAAPRKGYERARRSHMGLIVHVFSQSESVGCPVSKMNFVDMAGYEDTRKKSSDGSDLAETSKINKSIYALLNVCHALSTNETHVPYRESKLTRILQDSLRATSKILLVSCLNPLFCQDTIYMVRLASRSCQYIHRTPLDSMKKGVSLVRQTVTSHKNPIPKSVSGTSKKLTGSKSHIYEKKSAVATKSALKARKLFDETSHSATKAKKEISIAHVTKARGPLLDNLLSEAGNQVELNSGGEKDNSFPDASNNAKLNMMKENEISIAHVTKASEPSLDNLLSEAGNHVELNTKEEKDNSFPDASNNAKLNMMKENDDLSLNASSEVELDPIVGKVVSEDKEDHPEKHTPYATNYSNALSIVDEGHNMNKENNILMANGDGSPSITSQIRDVYNTLKWMHSSTLLCTQIPEKECTSLAEIAEPRTPVIAESVHDTMPAEIAEPRTPVNEQNMCFNERRDLMNAKSPWETFSMRSSGMKNSLVQEYLRFLNTADKEELKKLKGIGEKRATYILELREESPEPFKSIDDLKDIGLSAKQIKGMVKKGVQEIFNEF